MKRIVLLLCVVLFCGCGLKYPETANINLTVPTQSDAVYTSATAFLHGTDVRKGNEIVVFMIKKEPVVKVPNISSPHIILTERIAGGLREQGVQFETNSNVQVYIELNKLLVTVTKPKVLYTSEAVSSVNLKIKKGEASLTRKYNREADLKSASLPKIDELEKMLNEQLSDIVNQILGDVELQEIIKGM
jgi:uncharacterized lipoprotein